MLPTSGGTTPAGVSGEYWRFDETGRHHRTRLAGDRLVGDRYEEIPIDVLTEDVLQGRSEVLHLDLRWEQGDLGLYVPETGLHIATFAGERARANREQARADQEQARADDEQAARIQADARADQADTRANREQARADQAEARIRQLEATIRQLRNQ